MRALHDPVRTFVNFPLQLIQSLLFDGSIQSENQLQQLLADAWEEQNDAIGVPGGMAAASEAPLILINGHVCALSPETPRKKHHGNERGGFQLLEPYDWESAEEATGFLLPRWMWRVVGGDTVSISNDRRARGQRVANFSVLRLFIVQLDRPQRSI